MHPEVLNVPRFESHIAMEKVFHPANQRLAMRALLEKSGLCPECHRGWLENVWCPACGYQAVESSRSWWSDMLRWFRARARVRAVQPVS
jgi:predicted amidophosphoribosyltransferase